MRIVIDIPEEVFDEIYNDNYYSLKGKAALRIGVRNGTPLPKGCGRLIDENELCEGRVSNDPVVIAAKCTQTIVEADKEGEQE